MIQTSAGYNPFPVVRHPEALMSFEVIPKALAKEEVTAETAETAKVGSVAGTVNGIPELKKKYGTLERFGWPLDGSCSLLPSSGAEAGFWTSSVTGSDGTFSSPVSVRYELPSPIDSYGWTFHFDAPGGVWASRVNIRWYDAEDALLGEIDTYPADAGERERGWGVMQYATDYSAVEFTFYGTNEPLRMLRLAEIDFGVSRHFDADSVSDVRIRYGMTVDASEFPAKELSFVFDNSDGEFNILSPAGVYQYWRNGQVLRARIRIGDEIVNMGTFMESTAEIGDSRLLVRVKAHDECYRLARQKYWPGVLAEEESVTLKTAVEDVLKGYDLRVNYNGLENEPVSLVVDANHYKRTMLRYLAQAARATVWIDRNNTVQFKRFVTPSADEADAAITPDELYDWSGVSISEEFTGCSLTVTREYPEGHDPETETETYTSGESDEDGENTVAYENPCVAPGKGQDVCDWLLAAANWRKKYAVKNRCDPAVEIGDAVVISDAFRNDDAAIVTGLDIRYNGALWAVTEAERSFG